MTTKRKKEAEERHVRVLLTGQDGRRPPWLLIVCDLIGDVQSHIFPRDQHGLERLFATLRDTGFDFQGGPFQEVWFVSEFSRQRLRAHPPP
jgi:hypothetical protein